MIRLNPPPQVLRHYDRHSWDGTEAWKLSPVSGVGFWKGKGKSTSFRSRNSYILASLTPLGDQASSLCFCILQVISLPNVLITCSIQKRREEAWSIT